MHSVTFTLVFKIYLVLYQTKECCIVLLAVPKKGKGNLSLIETWQISIKEEFENWMNPHKNS